MTAEHLSILRCAYGCYQPHAAALRVDLAHNSLDVVGEEGIDDAARNALYVRDM
ncbi:hypothetical protein GCM10007927_37440 [Sulfitobacter pacificus]|uniref:Uncharacterized protein n=1 Tax=Sulfitobacter pacificus TaxID=1499314 RepID=A0ABQ5VP13_9RHOB|nr:hypothetical protein GCM10007927_37440 [Sulfitobacter pacificus]